MNEGELYSIKRLNRAEFAAALRKGQGRAMLHVQNYGLEGVAGLVLEACLHNQAYDQQLESIRGDWLFSMFRDSAYFPEFRKAILKALEIETSTLNLFQLTHLASEIAALWDDEARRVFGETVYRIAADPAADDWIGVRGWLDLEGVPGLLKLAHIYGQRLLDNPDDFINDHILSHQDYAAYRKVLEEYAQKDTAIQAFWEYLKKREMGLASIQPVDREIEKKKRHDRVRREYSLEGILKDAQNGVEEFPGRYLTFGKHAPPEELEQVYVALMDETREPVRTRLLWVFRRRSLPHLDDVLFDWATGANDDLRAAAIGALAQNSDEQVHDLARLKTSSLQLLGADHKVLGLFLRNYQPEDAALIIQSLNSLQAIPEDAHELSYDLIELAKKYQDPGLAEGLLWVYENTPCAFCRLKAVTWLDRHHRFTGFMRYECLHDADEDVREFARN